MHAKSTKDGFVYSMAKILRAVYNEKFAIYRDVKIQLKDYQVESDSSYVVDHVEIKTLVSSIVKVLIDSFETGRGSIEIEGINHPELTEVKIRNQGSKSFLINDPKIIEVKKRFSDLGCAFNYVYSKNQHEFTLGILKN